MTSPYEGEERRAKQRWKINKEVSLADIVTVISAILAVLYAYTTLDKRTSLIEASVMSQTAVDKRQDEELLRMQLRLETQLNAISVKVDRLLELRANGRIQ